MYGSPDAIIMVAQARHRELLAEAERDRLCWEARPHRARLPMLAAFVRTLLGRARIRSGGSRMAHPAEESWSVTRNVGA